MTALPEGVGNADLAVEADEAEGFERVARWTCGHDGGRQKERQKEDPRPASHGLVPCPKVSRM